MTRCMSVATAARQLTYRSATSQNYQELRRPGAGRRWRTTQNLHGAAPGSFPIRSRPTRKAARRRTYKAARTAEPRSARAAGCEERARRVSSRRPTAGGAGSACPNATSCRRSRRIRGLRTPAMPVTGLRQPLEAAPDGSAEGATPGGRRPCGGASYDTLDVAENLVDSIERDELSDGGIRGWVKRLETHALTNSPRKARVPRPRRRSARARRSRC